MSAMKIFMWKPVEKLFLIAMVHLFISVSLFGQVPNVEEEWTVRFNGSANDEDQAYDIAVDSIGNVYVTGASKDSLTGYYDYVTIKYNSGGTEKWRAGYDWQGLDDKAWGIAVDGAGNVYVTGGSTDTLTIFDYATIKYDSTGNEIWVARYDSMGGDDEAFGIALDGAGYVYVTGRSAGVTGEDYVTIKYDSISPDSIGVPLWIARYDGPDSLRDHARAIAIDKAGYVYVTGRSEGNATDFDYATIKYNPDNGDTLWTAKYNNVQANRYDRGTDIAVDEVGNVYVTGQSFVDSTVSDYATVKYDLSGTELWVNRYGPGNGSDVAWDLVVDETGDVYVTGGSYGDTTHMDYATIKHDGETGDTTWTARYNGPVDHHDEAYAIELDECGNVYVTGSSFGLFTDRDYVTIKYDPDRGDPVWTASYNGPSNGHDLASAIAIDGAGNVCVTGWSSDSLDADDYLTIKYSQLGIYIDLSPSGPITVPRGGMLEFDAFIRNCSDRNAAGEYWRVVMLSDSTEIFIPSGLLFYVNPLSGQVPSLGFREIQDGLYIPYQADIGSYWLIGRIGRFPDNIVDEESFGFQVIE
jgi:hypothetical protein